MENIRGRFDITSECKMNLMAKLGNAKEGIHSKEGFTLKPKPTGRTYRFKFDSPKEKDRLMSAIRFIIQSPEGGEEEAFDCRSVEAEPRLSSTRGDRDRTESGRWCGSFDDDPPATGNETVLTEDEEVRHKREVSAQVRQLATAHKEQMLEERRKSQEETERRQKVEEAKQAEEKIQQAEEAMRKLLAEEKRVQEEADQRMLLEEQKIQEAQQAQEAMEREAEQLAAEQKRVQEETDRRNALEEQRLQAVKAERLQAEEALQEERRVLEEERRLQEETDERHALALKMEEERLAEQASFIAEVEEQRRRRDSLAEAAAMMQDEFAVEDEKDDVPMTKHQVKKSLAALFTPDKLDDAKQIGQFLKEAQDRKAAVETHRRSASMSFENYKLELTKGVEVKKHHQGKKGCATRVAWIDAASTYLFVAAKKTEKENSIKKRFPFADMQSAIAVPGSDILVAISTAKGEVLRLEFKNQKARDDFVEHVVECVCSA